MTTAPQQYYYQLQHQQQPLLYPQQQQPNNDSATQPTTTTVIQRGGGGGGSTTNMKGMTRPKLINSALSSEFVTLPRMDLATTTAYTRMSMKRNWEAASQGGTVHKKQCTTMDNELQLTTSGSSSSVAAPNPTTTYPPHYNNYWGQQSSQQQQPQQVPLKPHQQQQVDEYNPRSIYQMLRAGSGTSTCNHDSIIEAAVDVVSEEAAEVGWMDGLFNILEDKDGAEEDGGGGESSVSDEENLPPPQQPREQQQVKQQPVSHTLVNGIVDDALSEISESDWNLLLDDNPTTATADVDPADTVYYQQVQMQPQQVVQQAPSSATSLKTTLTQTVTGFKEPFKPRTSSTTSSYLEEMRRNYYKCTRKQAPQGATSELPKLSLPNPTSTTSRPGVNSPPVDDSAFGVRQSSPTPATATSSTRICYATPAIVTPQVTPQTTKATVSCKNMTVFQQQGAFDMNIDELKSSQRPVLLTLTSFPFRILHVNNAYADLTGRKASEVIGQPFYDLFVGEKESMVQNMRHMQQAGGQATQKQNESNEDEKKLSKRINRRPSIATCTTPLGKFEQDVVKVRRVVPSNLSGQTPAADEGSKYTFCKIQVRPVYNFPKQPEKGLKYYAIDLDEVRTAASPNDNMLTMMPTSLPSLAPTMMQCVNYNNDDHRHKQETEKGVVYLPMPSGCMTTMPSPLVEEIPVG